MNPLLSANALQVLLHDTTRDVLVLDARFDLTDPIAGLDAWRDGHIAHALYADLDQDLSGPVVANVTGRHPLPDVADWQATLRRWGVTKNTVTVVYDAGNSMFAARAWWMLRWAGLTQVLVLNGGLAAWQDAGFALSTDVAERPLSDLTLVPHHEWLVGADKLLTNPEQHQLFDARAYARFSGQTEPLDKKAGHIPGAVCLDFSQNLQANGQFLPPAALRERFAGVGIVLPVSNASPTCFIEDKQVVWYCGSGVSACHNILAMVSADLPMPLLYAGSWSEWIQDDARPVATGDV